MNKLFASLLFCIFIVSNAHAELNLELPELNLPEIGSQSSNFLAPAKEAETGLKVLRMLRASGDIIEDPEINQWIRSLGNRLTSRTTNTPHPFYYVVSKNTDVNAFATLGGVIVINAGLILRTNTESELAAVIAHEAAHLTQRHIPRMLEKAESNKFATGAALLAGVIAGTKDSQAGQAIINTTLATMAHKQLAFGRAAEAEADRAGLRMLAGAGFNPQGMPNFLRKLEPYIDSATAEISEFLRNHPLTIKRVSDTSARAKQFGDFRGKENVSYLYMREKVRALIGSSIGPPNNIPANIKKYSNVVKLKQRRATAAAIKTFGQSSGNLSESILLAELLQKQGRSQQAVNLLSPLNRIHPGNEAISVILANAYLSLGQRDQAWKIINAVNVSEQTSLESLEVKQQIARLTGHTALAYLAVAERNIRTGNYRAARIQLQQAVKLPGANVNELRYMQQLLSEISTQKR